MTEEHAIRRVLKPAVFGIALLPFLLLLSAAMTGALSANPIDAITDDTGRWALRFLIMTLAITPLRRLTGWNALIRFRRMLGLYAFFYATLHFLTYFVLDEFFDIRQIAVDLTRRPFITVGFTAFVLLIPLAVTSTAGMIRRLGGKRWQLLHRFVYVSALGGVVHYLWLVKADIQRPLIYGGVLTVLLTYRLWPPSVSRW